MQLMHKYHPWIIILFLLFPFFYLFTLVWLKTFWKRWIAWAVCVALPLVLLPLAPDLAQMNDSQRLQALMEARAEFARYHHTMSLTRTRSAN
jgi:hypothetical protein